MLFSEFLGTRHDCLLDPHMKISPLNAITAILTSRQIWIGLLLFKYRFTDLLVNVFLVVSAVTPFGSTVQVGPFPRLQQREDDVTCSSSARRFCSGSSGDSFSYTIDTIDSRSEAEAR